MKIKKLSYLGTIGFLSMALWACSDNSDEGVNRPASNENGELNYISVNIVSSNASTRADAVADASNYEDGEGDENTVNTVRLYFFKGNGDPFVVNVADGTQYSYVTASSEYIDGGQNSPNVEKIITATAAVSLPKGEFPSQVIAVINPDANLSNLNLASLSQLSGAVNINGQTGNFFTPGQTSFVMSNSVYASSSQELMETTLVSSANFFTAPGAAQANPVTIYVERVVGKVSLTTSLSPTTGLTASNLYATGATYNNQPVYVQFLGWNVTSTTGTSYLMKQINPEWPENLFGQSSGQPWNYAGFYRSFWAINPADVVYNYYNFGFQPDSSNNGFTNSENPYAANAITCFTAPEEEGDPVNYTYLQENAAQNYETGAGTNHPSQVIVAAQLCDANGNPLTFAEWGYGKYEVSTLKNVFLTSIVSSLNPYKKTTSSSGTTYSQISTSDIEFVTAMSLDPNLANWVEKGRYYVFAQLVPQTSEDGVTVEWVNGDNDSATTLTAQQINDALKGLGHAKIWNNGYTYYYFDIEHLGAEDCPGEYGVVRNHVYKCDIKTLTGLGTPVFDPTETIYPEKPSDEETYIAAKINILSWRIVSQEVNFAW